MINDWRNAWSRTFPFYIVQLANYQKQRTQPVESDWAELREAQMQTLHLENTGIAVTIDIGDADDIHPKNKQEVGRRLALNALALTYGKNIDYSGPVFSDYEILQAAIRVKYNHAEGLKTADGKSPAGFAIAGPDRKFYWADARIEGESIVLSADKVPFPVAVRYAWADNPVCNVTNQSNLPAAPFRTDNW
jgi:sialate O-acetylesterase